MDQNAQRCDCTCHGLDAIFRNLRSGPDLGEMIGVVIQPFLCV